MVRRISTVHYFIPETKEQRRKMFLLADTILGYKTRFKHENEIFIHSDSGASIIIPANELHKYELSRLIAMTEADIDRELIQLTLESSKLY